ncbi:hypothetical protein ACIPPM_23585 [Streptomyces sp. NPDC090119]|uniref:hypothetical protein n=1 Tax=Streptomyces sp. NPDC090119 TaxID=3365951 RepID=UPI003822D1B8
MGASGWDYVTPYRGSVEATLEALQDEVFHELYGDGEEYGSRAELYADEEFMAEEGTHSILDVRRVAGKPGAAKRFTFRPLPAARLVHHFGTDRPSVRQYEDAMARAYEVLESGRPGGEDATLLGEHRMSWTGVHVVLHADGRPTHVGFFGSSGD